MKPSKIFAIVCLVMLFAISAQAAKTVKFTDMAGRTVEIPARVTKVFSTNPMGTLYMYAVAPEKVAGLNWAITPMEKKYTSDFYQQLPVLGGNFGGKMITFNFEEIIRVHPDFILAVGDINPFVVDGLDKMQQQLGIPVVLLDGAIQKTSKVLLTLGRITQSLHKAARLAAYVTNVFTEVETALAKVPEDRKVTVFYAEGAKGLETDPSGSRHSEVIDVAGGVNVARVSEQAGYGRTTVSVEQVLAWNPDVIIVCSDQGFSNDRFYTTIFNDPLWAGLKAVRSRDVYETPFAPFNWMDRPPSINRIMGLIWMTNLLYPHYYDVDIKARTKEFYELFYNRKLSDGDVDEILKTSVRTK